MKKPYYPSDDPERCDGVQVQHGTDGRMQQKLKCHKKALWQIAKLRLCYTCFEDYLARHDVDLASAIRLSDAESDFVEHHVGRKNELVRQFPRSA